MRYSAGWQRCRYDCACMQPPGAPRRSMHGCCDNGNAVTRAKASWVADGAYTMRAGSVNFRDVMLAYGKLSKDLMAHANGGHQIGLEFSGKV